MTPVGDPTETPAKTELYFETFFSAPYSAMYPNVPNLKYQPIQFKFVDTPKKKNKQIFPT